MTLAIRPATRDDRPDIVKLWHDGWHEAHHHLVPQPVHAFRTPAHFELWLTQSSGTFSVAVQCTEIVGFHCVDGKEISKLYVHSSARGNGTARYLLDDAEHRLQLQGVETAHLYCTAGNDRAERFYRRHGWQCQSTSEELLWLPYGIADRYRTGTRQFTKTLVAP